MAEQQLLVKIVVNKETGELQVANAEFEKFSNTAGEATTRSSQLTMTWQDLFKAAGLGAFAFSSMQQAMQTVANTMKTAVKEATDSIRINKELKFTIESLGEDYGKWGKELDDFTEKASKQTEFSDGEMKQAYISLAKYIGNANEAYKMLKLSMNVAADSGKELTDVAYKMGAAIAVPETGTRVLRREFGSLVGDGKDLDEMFNKLKDSTKGAAVEMDDFTVKTKKVDNAFKDLLKTAGQDGIEVANWFLEQIKKINDAGEKFFENLRKKWNVRVREQSKAAAKAVIDETNDIYTSHEKDLDKFYEMLEKKRNEHLKRIEELEKDHALRVMECNQAAAEFIGQQFGDAFAQAIVDGKSMEEAMKQILDNIMREVIATTIKIAIMNAIMPGSTAGMGGTAGFISNMLGFASGGEIPYTGPIYAHRGEYVIPTQKSKASQINTMGGNNLDLNVLLNQLSSEIKRGSPAATTFSVRTWNLANKRKGISL